MNAYRKKLESTLRSDANKNYYAVSFSSNGCNFEILVNDTPVYRYFKEGGTTGMCPINPWILKSGKQHIKVRLYPVKNHEEKGINAKRPLLLTVKYKNNPDLDLDSYQDVLSDFIPEITEGIPYFEYEAAFVAEVPYEMDGWESCIDLKQESDLKKQVVKKYQKIGEVILKRDFQQLSEILAIKNTETFFSLYMSEEEGKNELFEMYEEMKEFTSITPMDDYQLSFYADRKLVILEDPSNRKLGFKIESEEREWCQLFFLGKKYGSNQLEVIF